MAKMDWTTVALVGGTAVLAVGGWLMFRKKPEPGVFNIQQPTATPGVVFKGEKVLIHCPISMEGGEGANINIIIQVQEASWQASPGDLIAQKSFNVKIASGETITVDFNYTAGGAIGNKDITVLINAGGENIDSRHFDDVFEVEPESGGEFMSFNIAQPQVEPSTVERGQQVTIVCNITSVSLQVVRLRIEVAESSALPSPGTLLETKTSPYFTIQPGEIKGATFTHQTKGAVGSKDISVFIEKAGQVVDSNHFDDAFNVIDSGGDGGETIVVGDITLGQPYAIPNPTLWGWITAIVCPITRSGGSGTLRVIMTIEISESSIWASPGDLLFTIPWIFDIGPNETKNIPSPWTASGARGSKDITVMVKQYGGSVIAENNFDDAFSVL